MRLVRFSGLYRSSYVGVDLPCWNIASWSRRVRADDPGGSERLAYHSENPGERGMISRH